MSGKKVLVVNPPLLLDEGFIDYPYFTGLGAASNAAALQAAGFSVTLADAQARPGAGARRVAGGILAGCETPALLDAVTGDFEAVVVCLPPFLKPQARAGFAAELFGAVRARFPGARLAAADCHFGGMHYVEYDARAFLAAHPQVEALARYETEGVLPALLSRPRGAPTRAAAGRAAELSPDRLAPPAWDLLDLPAYFAFLPRFFKDLDRPSPFADGLPTLPALTSRGCARRCAFCTSDPGQRSPAFRPHGLDYLAAEFARLKRLGARRLALLDGCANEDPARFLAVLELLLRLELRCEFPNGLRADRLTLPALRALKRLGASVAVSAESADLRMLKALGKGQSPEDVERVARWCRRLSLPLSVHYLVGCPGETVASANRTLAHALRLKETLGAEPLVQSFVPIPGTALHRACAERGLLEGFDEEELYRHFQGAPAIGAPGLGKERLSRMTALFRRRLEAGAPRKLIVNLTYHCSNDCRFCAIGDRPKRHGDFGRIARLLAAFRRRGVRALDLDGGEPTLYPRLFDVTAAARRLGYERIAVTSNGRRLADRAFACRFLLSGVSELLISLHGPDAQTHERETRASGSFAEAVAGLRHAVRLKPGGVALAVNTMVTAENAPQLERLLGLVRDLGVEKANLQLVTPFGRAAVWASSGMELAEPHLRRALERWGKALRLEVVNALPCQAQRLGLSAGPELGKHSRHMAFVDAPARNLADYLDERRAKTEDCGHCEFSIGCAGFYRFAGARATEAAA